MTQNKETTLSDVDLEWFVERLTGGIADRLNQRLREIVRDEMETCALKGGAKVSS